MVAAPRRAWLLVAAGLVGGARAAEPTGIVRCQEGAEDILGERKAFTVQVCNLFGATCYMNHPSVASANCATEALAIDSGECKLYPIFEYEDDGVRSGSDAVEDLSTVSDLGCSVSSSSSVYKWSGACVAVQCSLGGDTFAGPGMTGTGSSRSTGVADTATAAFTVNTLAELPDEADQLKNVFLYRTGNYVATWSKGASGSSGDISYSVGSLPTSDGNNYGPVACPSSGNAMTSSAATGITAANLRMCGSTGKWVYYNAVNLLVDATHYASMTADAGSTVAVNINAVPFLMGKSNYRSGEKMDDPRAVKLHSGVASSSDALMTSETITPDSTGAAEGETAGTWRNYGVVFYCDKYDRTDLTACPEANRKMFYVADPNPNAQFGTTAGSIGSGGASDASAASLGVRFGTSALFLAAARAMALA